MIDDIFADRASPILFICLRIYHPMLDGRSLMEQEVSRHYCEFRYGRYGRYGIFASLPLLTAVLETQTYSVDEFRSATNAYSHKSSLSEFINALTYAGKDCFTIEESLFLLHLINLWKPVKDEQLEADLSGLARQGGSVIYPTVSRQSSYQGREFLDDELQRQARGVETEVC
jgi:hypothetical protein